jgi:quercetin dioxygenase-like cupin family protein
MKVKHFTEIELEDVTMEGARKAKIRWLISRKDNAPNFAMRMFELEPGGFTPYHSHEWEHENFIVEGEGTLVTEEGEFPFKTGDVIYVEPYLKHNYKNSGDKTLKFLCLIPHDKPAQKKKSVNPFASGVANNC